MEMGHAGTEALQAGLRAFQLGPLGLVPCNVAVAVAPTQSQTSPQTLGAGDSLEAVSLSTIKSLHLDRPLPGAAQCHAQATCICGSPGGPGGTAGL